MIATLHTVFAWVVVIANALVGVWASAAHFVERLRVRALWPAVACAHALLFVEVAFGVARLGQLDTDPPQFHTFYGFLTLIAVAILYGYRQQVAHVRHLVFGLGSLFIMGLAIRAMVLDASIPGI